MEQLVRDYVDSMVGKDFLGFEKCLDELRTLGQAEIESSSRVDLGKHNMPSFDEHMKELRRFVEPNWFTKLTFKDQVRIGAIRIQKHYVEVSLKHFKYKRRDVQEQYERVVIMHDVANAFQKYLGEGHMLSNPRSKAVLEVIAYRKVRLLEQMSVLAQGIMALDLVISSAQTILDAADKLTNTHQLAKSVNEQVTFLHEKNLLGI